MEESQEFETQDYGTGNMYVISDAAALKQALMNEKASPELLEYQEEVMERLQTRLAAQEQRIDQYDNPEQELPRTVYRTEVDRVKYLLRSYLRTRLRKVERFCLFILDNEEAQQMLSDKEMMYAKEYFTIFGRHFKELVLKHMPASFNNFVRESDTSTSKDMVTPPNLGTHVFCRVLEDQGIVDLDPDKDEQVEFNKDDLFVVRHGAIRGLLRDGWVRLV